LKRKKLLSKFIWSFLLLCIIAFVLFPFFQVLSTSLKSPQEQFKIPVNFIPKDSTIINFKQALGRKEFVRYFINSLVVSSSTMIVTIFVALIGAYGFTRIKFPGRKFFLVMVLFGQLFCLPAIAVPIYKIIGVLKISNSYQGLIISYLAFTVPVSIWLFRGFLYNIPKELEEASLIDGCTKLSAFWKIVVPLLRPAIGAIGAYVFFLTWQEFLFALIIMTKKEYRTLPIGIMDFVGYYETNWGNLMAASILITLPVFVIFMFLQRQLIEGLTQGSVKG